MTELSYDVYVCRVCYNTYDDPCCLKCGHTFCRKCTDNIFDTSKKCPICNTKFKKKEYQIVYDLIKPNNSMIHNSQKEIDDLSSQQEQIRINIELKKIELTKVNSEVNEKQQKLTQINDLIYNANCNLNNIKYELATRNNSMEKQLKLVKYFIKTGITIFRNDNYVINGFNNMILLRKKYYINGIENIMNSITFESYVLKAHNSMDKSSFTYDFRDFDDLSKQMKIVLLTYYSTDNMNKKLGRKITDNDRIIDGIYISCLSEMDMNILADNLDILNVVKN